jgi:ankyrin repeat protein
MNFLKNLLGGSRSTIKANADALLLAESNGLLTVLIAAVGRGDRAAVNALIAAGINVNETNNKGVTALMVAADKGDVDSLKALIAAGANLNTKDKNEGATALHVAAYKGYLDCVKALVAAGSNINATDNRGFTPLFTASMGGSNAVEAVLRNAGASR